MNVNKVILVGRLTRDPDMRTTPTGQSVATLGMATNNYWTDKAGQKQEKTEFHTVVLWGKLAEIAGQYLTKGQECFVEGRLQSREYTDKQGQPRKVTEIVGENMQLGSRAQGGGQGGSYQASSAPRPAARPAAAAPAAAPMEEEIPTINLDDEKEIRIEDVPF
ncbi:MAG: single-stranded DNA-binding protein [Candidatus Moranbacteria bacterium]|nr:single-stranded DNA-binding protein [Candidatus Moranbacteria bacterium]MBP6034105.1 single-stranded DNA-binding protein [Candidatus Moranbacteria bacterium]MBP7695857.1 single-stranded DNA-binding protein [Candidatus Moranbacteria bacterium]